MEDPNAAQLKAIQQLTRALEANAIATREIARYLAENTMLTKEGVKHLKYIAERIS